jgi:hypothetical protein
LISYKAGSPTKLPYVHTFRTLKNVQIFDLQ